MIIIDLEVIPFAERMAIKENNSHLIVITLIRIFLNCSELELYLFIEKLDFWICFLVFKESSFLKRFLFLDLLKNVNF